MNRPPEKFKRVSADQLQSFAAACLRAAGMQEEHADQLAELLTNSDLRGVRSHGTRAMEAGCFAFSVQGAFPQYYPSNKDKRAAYYGNPPLCFGLPGQDGPPLVLDAATLPGTIEHRKEEEYRQEGIPTGLEDLERLEKLGKELGVPPPWA